MYDGVLYIAFTLNVIPKRYLDIGLGEVDTYFAAARGYQGEAGDVFTSNAWVQSYGTRGVKPPIVFGDIKWKQAITTDHNTYASSLTDKEVKGMLTGPVAILNWSFPREDISTKLPTKRHDPS